MRRFSLAFALALVLAPLGASATTYTLNIGGVSATTDSNPDAPIIGSVLGSGSYTVPTNITSVDVFSLSPNPGSGNCSGSGCVANGNPPGTNDGLETDTITFKLSGMTVNGNAVGNITETGTYTAAYGGPELACAVGDGVSPSSGETDCLVWAGATNTWNGSKTVSELIPGLNDYLNITYYNGSDWTITNTKISVTVTGSPSGGMVGVPEPASLALLGTAIAGLGLLRQRRKRA